MIIDADIRRFNIDNIAKRLLRMVADTYGYGAILFEADPFMTTGIF